MTATEEPMAGQKTRRILIVEDEGIVAFALRMAVEDMGHKVVAISRTGAEAMAVASAERPDLVLMDIRLPGGMDGIEAAESIRHELLIPSIFVTGNTDEETRRRAMAAAPVAYLQKPVEEYLLAEAITQALY